MRSLLAGSLLLGLALLSLPPAHAADVAALVKRIKAVGPEGQGNDAASTAWRELSREGPDTLPALLTSLDDANPIAANWLRAAVDAIAERTFTAGKPLPKEKLEGFVKDSKHSGPARRLAYEWLAKADPSAGERLLAGFLDDPSAELRRDAVASLITEADKLAKSDKEAAKVTYQKALTAARAVDQVELIAKQLKALGAEVDLATKFGFLRSWWVAAPFENKGEKGFGVAYEPEKKVDLSAGYKGIDGKEVKWTAHTTKDAHGIVDFNTVIGKLKGTVGYAYVVVDSKEERPVEVRYGSNNAAKVFVNGKEVVSRDEYHHGTKMDQYVAPVTLKAGKNEILVKCLQNEQNEAWTVRWDFQLRVTDNLGTPIPLTIETPKPNGGK